LLLADFLSRKRKLVDFIKSRLCSVGVYKCLSLSVPCGMFLISCLL